MQKKKYSLVEFFAASLMAAGLCIFGLADSQVSPKFNHNGIAMLTVALIADAVVSNVQEKALKKAHLAVNAEVILYSYGFGTLYLLTGLIISGRLWSGFWAFNQNPVESYTLAFVFSLTGYMGMQVWLMNFINV